MKHDTQNKSATIISNKDKHKIIKKKSKKRTRCSQCKKRLTPLQSLLRCHCEQIFCKKCKITHKCSFDHHKYNKQKLENNLTKIVTRRI